jgi:ribonuclease E
MGIILRYSSASLTKSRITIDVKNVLRQWEAVRELTSTSTAPALVYRDASPRNASAPSVS